tara:strand:- start:6130 stop:7377 length:1248 start_codon:yes stop_codon:yes gene_type:complete
MPKKGIKGFTEWSLESSDRRPPPTAPVGLAQPAPVKMNKKNMKIAILMFGQPRFLKQTINLIKDEFDLPGHEVHYFAHWWNSIGYLPNGKEEIYDKKEIYDLVEEKLPNSVLPNKPSQRNIIIQDYENLDETCNHILNFIRLHKRNLPISINCAIENLRYKFGQHQSMKWAFRRILSYEKENDFKYDVVIKVRTDIVYKSKDTYESEEEYYAAKEELYTDLCFNVPHLKCTALRYVDLTERRKDKAGSVGKDNNIGMFRFYKNNISFERRSIIQKHKNGTFEKHIKTAYDPENECHWIKHTEDYNKRLAFNDWTLICNRDAAEIMYCNWFENYFLTLSKDIKNNNTNNWFISQSDHCLQGQMLLNYNLAAERISPRRDARLIHPKIIKKDIKTGGKIKAESEAQIRKDILTHKFS